ncbi:helix-turn-helix domain-containing protein, partial [Enterococcus faecalis]
AIRPHTDLLFSDYLTKSLFSVKCLIWLAPPRASDCQNFGNEIVRINKELQQTKQRKRE